MSGVRPLRATTAALLVVAVVALVAAGTMAFRRTTPESSAATNVAVVDKDATADVVEAVERGFGEIFVYDYRRPHRAERAAASFLTGEASAQYEQIYDALAAAGPRQQLLYRSTVSRVGVQRLTSSSAQLLVFLEQETIRTTDGATNRAPAQIRVEAVRSVDTWKVSSIELL